MSFSDFNEGRPHVWLVTDRPFGLPVVAAMMRKRRWLVDLSASARLSAIESAAPHLVVIDQGTWPPARAFEMASHLRTHHLSKPLVLVMTTLGLPTISDQARAVGCSCLTIPCSAEHIVVCARSALALAHPGWAQSAPEPTSSKSRLATRARVTPPPGALLAHPAPALRTALPPSELHRPAALSQLRSADARLKSSG